MPLLLLQCCCSPGDEKEENDVEGQNQEEHMLSQYIPPDIDRMPEIPSDLTRLDNLSNFNDNKQVERNSPIPNLRKSVEDLRHSNETPYLQEVGRNSVDRSESNINVQNPNKSDSVPEYVGEIDDFQSVPNNIATIVNESKVTYTTQVTDQPSAITSGQEKLATAYVLSTSRSDDYSSRNPDPYSDYSSRNPDPYDTSNT